MNVCLLKLSSALVHMDQPFEHGLLVNRLENGGCRKQNAHCAAKSDSEENVKQKPVDDHRNETPIVSML